jgi:cell division protein FtsB
VIEKLKNVFSWVLPVFLLIVLIFSFFNSLSKTLNGNKLIEKTEKKLEKAKIEEEELEKKLEITQSVEFIEGQIRNKLGLVKEGETILVLPDNETLKKISPQIPKNEEEKPLSNIQKWLKLFF